MTVLFCLSATHLCAKSDSQNTLSFEPCQIALGATTLDAQCAVLQRPENPALPKGRLVDLFVAKISSTNPNPADDALTLIQGGPGGSSIDLAIQYGPVLRPILAKRDVIVVDQRGTGRSNLLACPDLDMIESGLIAFDEEKAREYAKTCFDSLSDRDLRFYTTSVAVQDLEAIRAAAGYSALTIYGVSYGTRVAQHYLRVFPEKTRAVILDGVVQPGLNLAGGEIARQSQRAFDEVVTRCLSSAACNEKFGNIQQKFDQLIVRLKQAPVTISLAHPTSAKSVEKTISEFSLYGAIRMMPYSTEGTALLPLLIDEAAKGNFAPLAAQVMLIEESIGDQFAIGMQNAVMCTEDFPFTTAADLADIDSTYFGDSMIKSFNAACSFWPQGIIDNDFHAPINSDVPVLILSGETDPITPPANGEQVNTMLSNSRHIVVPSHGHGVLTRGCLPALFEEFVESADLDALKLECVSRERAMPFFIDPTGPAL